MENYEVLIVGTGHGGAQAATALRQHGFQGSIAILGEEFDLPYERPPLSKEFLAGEKPFERLLIRPANFWRERQIVVRIGCRVDIVEPDAHQVVTADGERIGYGALIWATGGHPRKLACSGHHLTGVHSIRTVADVRLLMTELPNVRRVAIIGGGYIGLEAAAALSKFGKSVTVIEALDRILSRVAGEDLSRFYESEHRAHGVEFRFNAAVECITSDETDHVKGVRLANNEVLEADMIIVGIGIVPATEPLLSAGASGDNGVKVDEFCRTSLPDVFAIGDCALHTNPFACGRDIRLESVQNATDMASTVAMSITGNPRGYHSVPWFWSNQYDLRLQTVGLSTGFDQAIIRGDTSSRSFSIIYLRNGKVIALDCVNATRDYVQGRALVISGVSAPIEQLADAKLPLKDLAPKEPAVVS